MEMIDSCCLDYSFLVFDRISSIKGIQCLNKSKTTSMFEVKKRTAIANKNMFNDYFVCAFFCGIHSSSPFQLSKRRRGQIVSILPRVIHTVCLLSFAYFIFRDMILKLQFLSINYFSVLTIAFPNAIILFSTFFSANTAQGILFELHRIKYHLKQFLKISIPLKQLNQVLRIKCVFGVIIIGVLYSVKMIIRTPYLSIQLDFFTLILVTCKCFHLRPSHTLREKNN